MLIGNLGDLGIFFKSVKIIGNLFFKDCRNTRLAKYLPLLHTVILKLSSGKIFWSIKMYIIDGISVIPEYYHMM